MVYLPIVCLTIKQSQATPVAANVPHWTLLEFFVILAEEVTPRTMGSKAPFEF
jgi:hypothetical protein